MNENPPRRAVLQAGALVPLGEAGAGPGPRPARIKLSCNLYSFNAPLRGGEMTLEQVIDFCAELGFDAVDPTGYYFPGHPEPPSEAHVNGIKRRASAVQSPNHPGQRASGSPPRSVSRTPPPTSSETPSRSRSSSTSTTARPSSAAPA